MGTIMIYFCSYIFVHVACQVITCSLPMFEADPAFEGNWTTSDAGALLGYASFIAAVGNGLWGPVIDRLGNRIGAAVGIGCCLFGCSAGVVLLSIAQTKYQLIAGALVIRLAYAAGFLAEIKAVHLTVPDRFQDTAVGMLGFGSRAGAIVGRAVFGVVLQWYSWRQLALWIGVMLAVVAAITVHLVLKKLAVAELENNPSAMAPPRRTKSVVNQFWHWLHEPAVQMLTVGFSFLCFIVHGDDLMPLLFYGLTGSSLSVALSAIFPIGGVCAMILNATQSHRVESRQRKNFIYVYLVAVSIGALAVLVLATYTFGAGYVPLPLVMVLLFIIGLTVAPAYYVLPNVFAMEYGGDDSATMVGFLELSSFLTKSPAHAFILQSADAYGWQQANWCFLLIASAAFVTMYAFVLQWHSISRLTTYAPHYDVLNTKQEGSSGALEKQKV